MSMSVNSFVGMISARKDAQSSEAVIVDTESVSSSKNFAVYFRFITSNHSHYAISNVKSCILF